MYKIRVQLDEHMAVCMLERTLQGPHVSGGPPHEFWRLFQILEPFLFIKLEEKSLVYEILSRASQNLKTALDEECIVLLYFKL